MPDPDRSDELLVSIVVPVFDAGAYLERCAPSLLRQSLGPDRYEVIYVDDGSTDGSAERLDGLAADHPHVRVHHQPNSGWPGKPRNVGIDLARGRYVQFVDQDDQLAPQALERLSALAERSSADVVLGMLAGTMLGPRRIYQRTVAGADVVTSRAFESLTGHKMFRRSFLVEHDIRFPEGYWRGEDLLFVVRAYAVDPRVSVLADYPCYFWNRREDGGNNSTKEFDLAGHYERLAVIIRAAADAKSHAVRDALLSRLYRVELLSYTSGPTLLGSDTERSRRAHDLCQRTARTVMPPEVGATLPALAAVRAAVLERGTWEQMRLVTTRADEIRPRLRTSRVHWDGGRLRMHVRATWLWRGRRLGLVRDGDGGYHFEGELLEGLPEAADVRIADPLAHASGEVAVRSDSEPVWWWAHSEITPVLEQVGPDRFAVALEGDVLIDPATIAGGAPLGHGEVTLSFLGELLGTGCRRRLRTQRVPGRGVVIGAGDPDGDADDGGAASLVRVEQADGSKIIHLHVQPARAALLDALDGSSQPSTLAVARGAAPQLRLPVVLPDVRLPREGVGLLDGDVRARVVGAGEGGALVVDADTSLSAGVHRIGIGSGRLILLVWRRRIRGVLRPSRRGDA